MDRCARFAARRSFFEAVPVGGDLYLLKVILHDFDDAAAARILRTIRDACDPGARLLVIERDLTAPETTPADSRYPGRSELRGSLTLLEALPI